MQADCNAAIASCNEVRQDGEVGRDDVQQQSDKRNTRLVFKGQPGQVGFKRRVALASAMLTQPNDQIFDKKAGKCKLYQRVTVSLNQDNLFHDQLKLTATRDKWYEVVKIADGIIERGEEQYIKLAQNGGQALSELDKIYLEVANRKAAWLKSNHAARAQASSGAALHAEPVEFNRGQGNRPTSTSSSTSSLGSMPTSDTRMDEIPPMDNVHVDGLTVTEEQMVPASSSLNIPAPFSQPTVTLPLSPSSGRVARQGSVQRSKINLALTLDRQAMRNDWKDILRVLLDMRQSAAKMQSELDLAREKIRADAELERAKIMAEMELERAKTKAKCRMERLKKHAEVEKYKYKIRILELVLEWHAKGLNPEMLQAKVTDRPSSESCIRCKLEVRCSYLSELIESRCRRGPPVSPGRTGTGYGPGASGYPIARGSRWGWGALSDNRQPGNGTCVGGGPQHWHPPLSEAGSAAIRRGTTGDTTVAINITARLRLKLATRRHRPASDRTVGNVTEWPLPSVTRTPAGQSPGAPARAIIKLACTVGNPHPPSPFLSSPILYEPVPGISSGL
eukprot:768476-Hanusia_phi.AAC.6